MNIPQKAGPCFRDRIVDLVRWVVAGGERLSFKLAGGNSMLEKMTGKKTDD
jgi:hypothetical protein